MAKARISKKRKRFSLNTVPVIEPNVSLNTRSHDPDAKLKNLKFIADALAHALVQGDKRAFLEVLAAHIKSKNISEIERRTKIKRSTIYSAIGLKANPTLDTIMNLIQKAS